MRADSSSEEGEQARRSVGHGHIQHIIISHIGRGTRTLTRTYARYVPLCAPRMIYSRHFCLVSARQLNTRSLRPDCLTRHMQHYYAPCSMRNTCNIISMPYLNIAQIQMQSYFSFLIIGNIINSCSTRQDLHQINFYLYE